MFVCAHTHTHTHIHTHTQTSNHSPRGIAGLTHADKNAAVMAINGQAIIIKTPIKEMDSD